VRRLLSFLVLTTGLVAASSPANASATAIILHASSAPLVARNLPLVRVSAASPLSAQQLPALNIHPRLRTTWRQVGPHEVDAYATGRVSPATAYVVSVPGTLSCTTSCVFGNLHAHDTTSGVDLTWADQLLAALNYLPVSFSTPATDLAKGVGPGSFTWRFPNLPARLMAQWQVGTDNVIVRGALMAFQDQRSLPTTGAITAATWSALLQAAAANAQDPATYDYVDVTMQLPETTTLYVNGVATFHTLANTGIAQAPTSTGTYPVYLRFQSTTMRGTNPDGSTYNDANIQWVSYFNGGDGLHEFPRATYGWPQSLGCVEMPMAAAKYIWPFTPIGTLVTVHA